MKKFSLALCLLFLFHWGSRASAAEWPEWVQTIPSAAESRDSLVLFSGWDVEGDCSARIIRYRKVIHIGSNPRAEDSILRIHYSEFLKITATRIWVRDVRGKVREFKEKRLTDLGDPDPGQFNDDREIVARPPSAGPGSTLVLEYEAVSSGFPRDQLLTSA